MSREYESVNDNANTSSFWGKINLSQGIISFVLIRFTYLIHETVWYQPNAWESRCQPMQTFRLHVILIRAQFYHILTPAVFSFLAAFFC